MVVMCCPSDIFSQTAGSFSEESFVCWKTALHTRKHLEVVNFTVRLPDLLHRFGSGPFLEDVVLAVAILRPTVLMTLTSTRQCHRSFDQVLLQSRCHSSWGGRKGLPTMHTYCGVRSVKSQLCWCRDSVVLGGALWCGDWSGCTALPHRSVTRWLLPWRCKGCFGLSTCEASWHSLATLDGPASCGLFPRWSQVLMALFSC